MSPAGAEAALKAPPSGHSGTAGESHLDVCVANPDSHRHILAGEMVADQFDLLETRSGWSAVPLTIEVTIDAAKPPISRSVAPATTSDSRQRFIERFIELRQVQILQAPERPTQNALVLHRAVPALRQGPAAVVSPCNDPQAPRGRHGTGRARARPRMRARHLDAPAASRRKFRSQTVYTPPDHASPITVISERTRPGAPSCRPRYPARSPGTMMPPDGACVIFFASRVDREHRRVSLWSDLVTTLKHGPATLFASHCLEARGTRIHAGTSRHALPDAFRQAEVCGDNARPTPRREAGRMSLM